MKHLQLLIKPASSGCNLRCSYCFYEDECENRQIRSYGIMKKDVLEQVVRKALEEAEESCTFGFQGGEPLLAGLDFFESFIGYTKKYKKPKTALQFSIQTNGTLLDERWIDLFRKNKFLVGISLDGTRELHDRNRVDAEGDPTFQKVLRHAHDLQKNQVDVNVLCVLTKQTAKKIRSVYQFLKKQGFFYHQYIPCLDAMGEKWGEKPWSLTPQVYGEAMKELFDLWFEDRIKGTWVSIREFDNWINMLRGLPPEACAQTGRCSMQNIIEANGDIFPCDFYVLDEHRIANVLDEDFHFFQGILPEKRFFQTGMERGPECKKCRWYPLCRGGCRRNYTEDGLNYFCPAYQAFFPYAIERMEYLASCL